MLFFCMAVVVFGHVTMDPTLKKSDVFHEPVLHQLKKNTSFTAHLHSYSSIFFLTLIF